MLAQPTDEGKFLDGRQERDGDRSFGQRTGGGKVDRLHRQHHVGTLHRIVADVGTGVGVRLVGHADLSTGVGLDGNLGTGLQQSG